MAFNNVSIIRPGFLLTSEWLRKEGACVQQRTRFKNVYPKGMRVTTRNLNIARSKHRLSTRWFIETILTWAELDKMTVYAGVNRRTIQWTKKQAGLLHSAFIRVLKERGNE